MNRKILVSLILAALLLVGCAPGAGVNDSVPPAKNPEIPTDPARSAAKPAAETGVPAETAAQLTEQEAQAAAFVHAGVNPEEATQVRARWEKEDGIPVWEVDFRVGDYEFDYTLHAQTGQILEWDKEYEPIVPPAAQPTETQPAQTQPQPSELTREEAVAIALEDAGLQESQVTRLKAEKDVDDGKAQWEVDFRSGEYEYDYTVCAATGRILDRDKEYDPAQVPPSEPAAPTLLTAEEAVTLALAHAGRTADQIVRLEKELDEEDGKAVWEVEFFSEGLEYSYSIHAETGQILEWEKETDD